jgi:hypothetical protein
MVGSLKAMGMVPDKDYLVYGDVQLRIKEWI